MKFRMIHNNFNVLDLDKSLKFYAEALDMKETRRISAPDGSFIIVYLKCDKGDHLLELTSLSRRTTTRPPMPDTKPWAASAAKIPKWESTSFPIPMTTGLRSFQGSVDPQPHYFRQMITFSVTI